MSNNKGRTFRDLFKRTPDKIRQYWRSLYNDSKCKCMSRGSVNINKIISWARGENWRRNTQRSEKKFSHKK
jgi:hypothetical protein